MKRSNFKTLTAQRFSLSQFCFRLKWPLFNFCQISCRTLINFVCAFILCEYAFRLVVRDDQINFFIDVAYFICFYDTAACISCSFR